MLKKLLNMLSSNETATSVCAMGNEAVARGAIEAGVKGVFAYPGNPSTEIAEVFKHISIFQNNPKNIEKYADKVKNKIYFEYSINEKIALEKAIAYAIGNKSAMCCMKNVGLNVASDALMTISYQTISAPLVIVVCDDPGCHSSSNEQDSRYWGKMASVPVFNPATPEDAKSMCIDAFSLSGKLQLPVILRMTTRVDHSRGMVQYAAINNRNGQGHFQPIPEHINIPARTAASHQRLLAKLENPVIKEFTKTNNTTTLPEKCDYGVITSGVASSLVNEILNKHGLIKNVGLLQLGLIHPFPVDDVFTFLGKNFKKVIVFEELDSIIEDSVRTISQKNKVESEIVGKGFAGLSVTGEYSLDLVEEAIEQFLELSLKADNKIPLNAIKQKVELLPVRPPVLCSGCPHRATFYALKLTMPRESNMVLCGDIGCFGLGALPPLKMIDTIHHMGMSISMAQGLSEAFKSGKGEKEIGGRNGKTIAMIGDGTFFHSGIPSLLNAVYTKANMLLIIFDNRTIGMTGHQDHPGANYSDQYNQLELLPFLKGMGVPKVETVDPFNIKESFSKMESAMSEDGLSVIISKSPCILIPDLKYEEAADSRIVVDPNRCNRCHNHDVEDLNCSLSKSPEYSLQKARAKIKAKHQINAHSQLCPANICNHGFFNTILNKDYKTAIELVRDKMLFSRTCGDICHRPCELFSGAKEATIPIKQLKNFISSFDDNFKDFSGPINRVQSAKKQNKEIAVIGSGPAGLSAAYDLLQFGYNVTIYEKESEAGGLIKYAIPDFRMDKKGFEYEVSQLEKMGANFKFNTMLGEDIQLKELSESNEAVIIATGMSNSKSLDIIDENIRAEQRWDAIQFLKEYNTNSLHLNPGSTVLVIGGGNSAIDAARTVKRLDKKNKVIVSCIETKENMPAFSEEVTHAVAERIVIEDDTFVKDCRVKNNDNISISLNIYSTKKRLKILHPDYIITAIGQYGNEDSFSGLKPVSIAEDSRIKIDPDNGYTNFKNVYASGDICSGNQMSIIGAIASGKRAVTGVRQMIEKINTPYEGAEALAILNNNPTPLNRISNETTGKEFTREIEEYHLFQTCEKCNHCIENFGCPALVLHNGQVVVDHALCTNCAICIDVCPNDAIGWEKVK